MEAPGLVFLPSNFNIVPVAAVDSHVYSPADGRILFPTIRLDLKPIGAYTLFQFDFKMVICSAVILFLELRSLQFGFEISYCFEMVRV